MTKVEGATTSECWACGSALNPAWRFCIRCGVPVERDELRYDAPQSAEPAPMSTLLVSGIVLGGVVALVLTVLLISFLLRS